MNILIASYFIFSIIYLVFACMYKLLVSKVPTFFPLLDYAIRTEMVRRVYLLGTSLGLFGVGYLLYIGSEVGLYLALVLSVWEVALAYFFYWLEKKDVFQAWIHFLIHGFIIIYLLTL